MLTRTDRRALPFAALTAAVSIGTALFFSLYSLVPVTRADTPELGSLYLGTLMGCVMAVQVFAPTLVRLLSLRWVLAGAAALLGGGALLTGLAEGLWPLLAGGAVGGAGFGVLIVVGAQGVALLVPAARLGRTLGLYGVVTVMSSAVGSAAGVQVAVAISPSAFGVWAAAAGILAALFALGVPGDVGGAAERGPDARPRRHPGRAAAPALGMLLLGVLLLSHGLSSLPALSAEHGRSAVMILCMQAGNALGRWAGGELEARSSASTTALVGGTALAAGGLLSVVLLQPPAIMAAAVVLGAGAGIVQTLSLHTAMRTMTPGRASVAWNLTFDGGLWLGGVLWGLALASGTIVIGVCAVAAAAQIAGVVYGLRLRRHRQRIA